MRSGIAAHEMAERWIGDLDGEDRRRWTAMPDVKREAARARLRALFSVIDHDVKPSIAAAQEGIALGRFYQILREWRTPSQRSLATLAVRSDASLRRSGRLKDGAAVAKTVAISRMQASLLNGNPEGTNALLDRIHAEVDGAVSIISLLRWWNAERRNHAVGTLGTLLSFDYCALDLPRSDGRLHSAAFVVDRGTRTILGASLGSEGLGEGSYYDAAADALERIPDLELARLDGSSRFKSVAVSMNDWTGQESLGFVSRMRLAASVVRPIPDENLFGRSVTAAVGDRWSTTRLRRGGSIGAAASVDGDIERSPVSIEEARDVLKDGLDEHQAQVRLRLSALPRSEPGVAAERRIRDLLTRLVGDRLDA